MLLSTSRTRTTPPPHTCDAAPVKSKVAPRITAAQGVDYYSTVRTVPTSLHREGHRHRMNRRTVVDTLYVVITAPRSRYIYTNNTVSRRRTRGESEDQTGEEVRKCPILALKPMANVTRSPKQEYQWPHKKNLWIRKTRCFSTCCVVKDIIYILSNISGTIYKRMSRYYIMLYAARLVLSTSQKIWEVMRQMSSVGCDW